MAKKTIRLNNTPDNNWEDLEDWQDDYNYASDDIYFVSNKEVQDYDFAQEPRTDLSKITVPQAVQLQEMLSFDYLKLRFPLICAEDAEIKFNRKAFMRSSIPQSQATQNETFEQLVENAAGVTTQTMELMPEEEAFSDKRMTFEYAKKKYPDVKPFYEKSRKRMGLVHMYVFRGDFIVIITGKIVCSNGDLGLINKDNINKALDVVKSTGLVDFKNEVFISTAEILSVHVTNDVNVGWVNPHVKAFSSYLPMRTDRYNVLKYNAGFLILPKGRPSKSKPNYEFCVYDKGAEIRGRHQKVYRQRIGKEGVKLADSTLRQELRLFNFLAIRKFVAPDKEDGTVTLIELLNCKHKPILNMLNLLEISMEKLGNALGNYITMYEDEEFPTQAEFERMQGLLRMLEQHDYDLDRVRSYIEAETNHKTHSTYFQTKRATLQQYVTCYKPRTVVLLKTLLTGMNY